MSATRILLAVTGLSPPVVTETVWALARESPPWLPDAICLLTTRAGALAAETGLPRALERLSQRIGHPLPVPQITVIADAAGRPIDDIASAEGNAAAADAITAAIRAATADPRTCLHVSVAGGRKTQGCLAAMALMLFGRAGDRLSHVLVPEALSARPDFWFPPATMHEDPVVLADIPYVRLRGLWRPEAIGPGWQAAVQAVQAAIAGPQLEIDASICTVRWGCCERRLPPQLLAVLAWLAERRLQGASPARWRDLEPAAFAAAITRLSGGGDPRRPLATVLKGDIAGAWLTEKVSRLNRIVRAALGPEAGPYLILRTGRRPNGAYQLATPPEAIRLVPPPSARAAA